MPKIHQNDIYATLYKFFGVLMNILHHRKSYVVYTLLKNKDGENNSKRRQKKSKRAQKYN